MKPKKREIKKVTSEEIELLKRVKKQLPNGAGVELAKRLNTNVTTISQILNGAKNRRKIEIINGIAEYLKEYQAKETEAMQAIKNVLNPETSEQLQERLNFQSEKYGENKSPLLVN